VVAAAPSTADVRRGCALRVDGLRKAFGGVVAVDDLTLAIGAGETLGVIGPNGAGKSTLLRLIAGEHRPDAGEIWLGDERIDHRPAHLRARAGIALAHQVPRPFAGLTVRDNLRVAATAAVGRAAPAADGVDDVLELTGLADRADRRAGELTLLDLKRLGLARALAQAPRLLLLDEVGAGLVAGELEAVVEIVRGVQDRGVTILVVEHVESVIRSLAARVVVLDWGRLLAQGTPEEIAADERVRAVYLGDGELVATAGERVRGRPAGPLLTLRGVDASYGGAHALRGVDLEVREGEVVAVVGANGAGKTTLSRVVSGLKAPQTGRLAFAGCDITGMAPHRRVELGIAHCQEGRRVFGELSVRENLDMGAYARRARRDAAAARAWVHELFPILAERCRQEAGLLSGGQQQMLAIGRALMSNPRLLVLDEASLGLAPVVVDQVYAAIDRIRERVAVLLIEQTVFKSLAAAGYVYVLDHGEVAFAGSPDEFESSADLAEVYFGTAG